MHTLHHRTCIQSNRPNTGAPDSLGYLLCWPLAFLRSDVGKTMHNTRCLPKERYGVLTFSDGKYELFELFSFRDAVELNSVELRSFLLSLTRPVYGSLLTAPPFSLSPLLGSRSCASVCIGVMLSSPMTSKEGLIKMGKRTRGADLCRLGFEMTYFRRTGG